MQTANEVKMRATNLRESLVALGHPIKHGQCLDVVSKLEGYADWNAYTSAISVNLNRAEQFLDEIIEGGSESSYEKFTQRFEKKYLVHFTKRRFQRELRAIREDFGDYKSREFLGCVKGDTDPENMAKYPNEIRYLWHGEFEKNEVLMVACIYCKNGIHHVSGFNLR